ncbi:MAG: twin-arginine translocase subunit TatC [Alphaproteobacteria bacterium]
MLKDIDEGKAPLLDHLIELRTRLVRSAVVLLVAFVASFFVAEHIYAFLARPLAEIFAGQEGRRLIFTGPHETFFTYVKVAFFAGLCIALPVIASQAWAFIAPGLYRREKWAVLPYIAAGPVLFAAGGAVVYYAFFPVALRFFLTFETPGGDGILPIELEARVSEYFSLLLKLIIAFGVCFQLPLVLTLAARAGLTTAKGLASKRKYAIVLAFVAAAILTPPDPFSQIGLALPVILLYEVSIVAVRVVEKRRAKREATEEEGPSDDDGGPEETFEETDFNLDR